MARVTDVGLKGWQDDQGEWHWTPEIKMATDGLSHELDLEQVQQTTKLLDSARLVIMGFITSCQAEDDAHRQEGLRAKVEAEKQRLLARTEALKPQPAPAQEAPKAAPVQETNGLGMVVIGAGLYDPNTKSWARCLCGNEDINQTSQTSGKPYQACKLCRMFLNPDGKTKSMGGGQ